MFSTKAYYRAKFERANNEHNEMFRIFRIKLNKEKDINLNSLEHLREEELMKAWELWKEYLGLEISNIDLDKLTLAINRGQTGGIALMAFTDYICKICGEEKSNPDSNVPKICPECARKVAKDIIMSGVNILKDARA